MGSGPPPGAAAAGPGRKLGVGAAGMVAALLGALQSLALTRTDLWWLALAAFAGLAGLLRGATVRRAAWIGWAWGCAALAATVWWLFISMYRYGHLPAPLAAAAVFLLSAFLALQPAAALAWAAARPEPGPIAWVLRFAAALLAAELARGQWFTGFPWGASGYGQVDGPLAGLAPWVGVYGIGAVLAVVAGLVAALVVDRAARARVASCLVGVVAVVGLAGWIGRGGEGFTRAGGMLRVALLQPDVAQDEKFATEHLADTLAWVGRALVAADADLVVAPETAIPLLPNQLADVDAALWPALQRHFGRPDGPAALVGMPLGDETRGYTNSAVGLSAGAAYRYDKVHLVPFGEFIPTGFRWFTELMQIPLGDFNRGTPAAPSFALRGERIAPNICYEDLFGEELALRFADPSQAPTVLANLSNIGWFGDTVALPQHLAISRLRSLELQRPMLRATNTGVTAVIDHRGRVTAQLGPFRAGVLDAAVQGRLGNTPYATWVAHAGLWPLWALALAILLRPARRAAGGR